MLVVHFSFISPYTCTHTYNSELQWWLSQSDQTIFYTVPLVEFSKNCAGFLWILRCVVLWTFLRVELMYFSLCNDSKTTIWTQQIYTIYRRIFKQGQVKGLTVLLLRKQL
jgi:hypothetical protein